MSATEKNAPKHRVRKSTSREPFHYPNCGLPNVWLVGVELDDEAETVGIPRVPALLEALAKTVAEKTAALTADELRFLRKRMRYASKDFATIVGLSPEQYSRIENGTAVITPMLDRLVRFVYAAKAKLPRLADEAATPVKWVTERTREERIVATQDAEHQWVIRTRAA